MLLECGYDLIFGILSGYERFLEECTVKEEGAEVKASELYQKFREWAEKNGEGIMSNQMFGRQMTEKEYEKKKSEGCIYYQGIKLRQSSENEQPHEGGSGEVREDREVFSRKF